MLLAAPAITWIEGVAKARYLNSVRADSPPPKIRRPRTLRMCSAASSCCLRNENVRPSRVTPSSHQRASFKGGLRWQKVSNAAIAKPRSRKRISPRSRRLPRRRSGSRRNRWGRRTIGARRNSSPYRKLAHMQSARGGPCQTGIGRFLRCPRNSRSLPRLRCHQAIFTSFPASPARVR